MGVKERPAPLDLRLSGSGGRAWHALLLSVALGTCIVLCSVPRGRWLAQRGWPFSYFNSAPYTYGVVSQQALLGAQEEDWRDGYIGPNGAHV